MKTSSSISSVFMFGLSSCFSVVWLVNFDFLITLATDVKLLGSDLAQSRIAGIARLVK